MNFRSLAQGKQRRKRAASAVKKMFSFYPEKISCVRRRKERRRLHKTFMLRVMYPRPSIPPLLLISQGDVIFFTGTFFRVVLCIVVSLAIWSFCINLSYQFFSRYEMEKDQLNGFLLTRSSLHASVLRYPLSECRNLMGLIWSVRHNPQLHTHASHNGLDGWPASVVSDKKF